MVELGEIYNRWDREYRLVSQDAVLTAFKDYGKSDPNYNVFLALINKVKSLEEKVAQIPLPVDN